MADCFSSVYPGNPSKNELYSEMGSIAKPIIFFNHGGFRFAHPPYDLK